MGQFTTVVHDHLVLPARVALTEGQVHRDRLLGRAVPGPVTLRLIVDTGSKRTALVPGVIDHLTPARAGDARVETSAASVVSMLYWLRLEFPDTALAPIPSLKVARLPLPPSLQAYHGLIGRDLLHHWESVLFEGRRGRLTVRDTPGGLLGWLRR